MNETETLEMDFETKKILLCWKRLCLFVSVQQPIDT